MKTVKLPKYRGYLQVIRCLQSVSLLSDNKQAIHLKMEQRATRFVPQISCQKQNGASVAIEKSIYTLSNFFI
jgi:hypothetical protein